MEKAYQENYKGYKIKIFYDEIGDYDDFFGMFDIFGYHRSYNNLYTIKNNYNLGNYELDFKQYLKDNGLTLNDVIYSPVSLYEHSGISLSLGVKHGWDYGQLGIIFITKKHAKTEYNVKRITKKIREDIISDMSNHLEYMTNIYNGNVFGFRVTDKYGEEMDACYGYVGEYSSALSEARGEVDSDIEFNEEQREKGELKEFVVHTMFGTVIEASNEEEARKKFVSAIHKILDEKLDEMEIYTEKY